MFASSYSDYEGSDYVIIGVPFDGTSSYRVGAADGPRKIRQSSHCFEPFLMEYGVSIADMDIHDAGDIDVEDQEDLKEKVSSRAETFFDDEKLPIFLGGEHSLTPSVVSSIPEEINVVFLDAHLDFRDTYEGTKNSHATAVRRTWEEDNVDEVRVVGVRSMSEVGSGEVEKEDTIGYMTADKIEGKDFEIRDKGIREILDFESDDKPIYLSIDMDVFDPTFAPGVGNPEPFGISSRTGKEIVKSLSSKVIGLDIVETCPKHDCSEQTSNLAARLIYEFLGSKKIKND